MSTISGTFIRKVLGTGTQRRGAKAATTRVRVVRKKLTKKESAKLVSEMRALLRRYGVTSERV